MHIITALFSTAKWAAPKSTLTDESINMAYVYIVEYYLALKKKNLIHATNTDEPWGN